MVANCCDPNFVRKFVVNFFFEEVQTLQFRIYNAHFGVSEKVVIGSFICQLADIINAPGRVLKHQMINETNSKSGRPSGLIIVEAEEVNRLLFVVLSFFTNFYLYMMSFRLLI